MPTVAADVTTVDTFLKQIRVSNTTAGALTITILDKQDTPRTHTPTVSIAANSVYLDVAPECILMKGGVNWVASGAGLEAEIFGYVRGA